MKAKWKVHNYFSVKSGCPGGKPARIVSSAMYIENAARYSVFVSIYIFLRMLNRWSLCFTSNDIARVRLSFQLLFDALKKKKCSKHVIYYSLYGGVYIRLRRQLAYARTNAKYCIINPVLYFRTCTYVRRFYFSYRRAIITPLSIKDECADGYVVCENSGSDRDIRYIARAISRTIDDSRIRDASATYGNKSRYDFFLSPDA